MLGKVKWCSSTTREVLSQSSGFVAWSKPNTCAGDREWYTTGNGRYWRKILINQWLPSTKKRCVIVRAIVKSLPVTSFPFIRFSASTSSIQPKPCLRFHVAGMKPALNCSFKDCTVFFSSILIADQTQASDYAVPACERRARAGIGSSSALTTLRCTSQKRTKQPGPPLFPKTVQHASRLRSRSNW